jgi:hypothetical protein
MATRGAVSAWRDWRERVALLVIVFSFHQGNTKPGVDALAPCALAVGDAEQADPSKAAKHDACDFI